MNFSRSLSAVLIGAAVAIVQPQFAVALTPVEVKAITKEFTIRIGGDGSGTGVIFDHKGDTYFVLTNRHVVSTDGRYEIQTNDGSVYPVYRSQELPGLDLAVLQFTSNKNYRTANFGNSDQIAERMTVYVAGWPADLLPGISERSYGFTVGSILRREPRPDQGYALVYDNEALPGMSGGPVIDENGRVVGINGRASANSGTLVRKGIPINTFLTARNNPRPSVPQTTATAPRQRTAEDFISLGGAKADKKDYQGAIANYSQAIQINPNNPDAYYRRGVAYTNLNNYQAALENFNQVLRLSPKNTYAYFYRGFVRSQLKDYKGGFADADFALRLDPNFGIGYGSRGFARFGQGDKSGAIADFDKMIQLLPNLAQAYSMRGIARAELPDKPGAIADFQKAADLYRQQENRDGYLEALNKIKKLQNTAPASQPATTSNQQDNQTAIATADQAIARNPKDATAYLQRAAAFYKQGDKQKSLQDLNQVTRINPKSSRAWFFQGGVLQELHRNEEAVASYDRAIQANNEWGKVSPADAYLNRGELRSDKGDYQGAIADFSEVIRLNPKNAVAYALRGLNYQRRGNNQAAVADFNSAARIDPNNAVASMVRGFTYHLQGDYQGALAAYEKAIALDAKLFPAVNNIGFVKYELGDVEGAIRQFQAAIAINSQSAEPQLAQAVALYTKGDSERGLAMAEAAIRLDNRFADVKFLKKNLWGDRILADTQKLLQNPRMRSLSSQ